PEDRDVAPPTSVGEIGEGRAEQDRAEPERREDEPDLGRRPAEPLLGEDRVGRDERAERRLERRLDEEEEDEDLRGGRPGEAAPDRGLDRRRLARGRGRGGFGSLPRRPLGRRLRQEQRADER